MNSVPILSDAILKICSNSILEQCELGGSKNDGASVGVPRSSSEHSPNHCLLSVILSRELSMARYSGIKRT